MYNLLYAFTDCILSELYDAFWPAEHSLGALVVEGRNVLLFNAFTIGLVDGAIAPSTGGMLQFQYYNWNVTIVV